MGTARATFPGRQLCNAHPRPARAAPRVGRAEDAPQPSRVPIGWRDRAFTFPPQSPRPGHPRAPESILGLPGGPALGPAPAEADCVRGKRTERLSKKGKGKRNRRLSPPALPKHHQNLKDGGRGGALRGQRVRFSPFMCEVRPEK